MKIGNIDLGERPLLLAPMEDVTDSAFRLLCRQLGASMVYSEFVAADALVREIASTLNKLTVHPEERPVAIQIYGRDPGALREAAQIVEERAHPDIIDLNFGCPVKKIAGKGAGSGLLQDVPRLLDIARSVAEAVKTPVTAKTRLGWDASNLIIETLAEQLQDTGIQALTIHGRTRAQMYNGEADWTLIKAVKDNPRIHIPIIGNGDVTTAETARRRFDETGVDAVMVGRATFGRPWVFKEMYDALHDRPLEVANFVDSDAPVLSNSWKLDVLKMQVLHSVARGDERRGVLHVRRHLAASPVFKGIPDFRQTRIAMLRATTVDELFAIMEQTRPLIQETTSNTI